jgi:hypothetical protein
LACSASAQTAQFYINNGVLNATNVPPQIDAINFVNNNQFNVAIQNPFNLNIELFETSSTLNFTNSATGSIQVSPGMQFDTAPATIGLRHRANSFVNYGTISAGSATNGFTSLLGNLLGTVGVFSSVLLNNGLSEVVADADELIMPGTANLGTDGLLSFKGNNINLDHGGISMEGFESSPLDTFQFFFIRNVGIFDNYWGVGDSQKISPSGLWSFASPITPVHTVTQLVAGIYFSFPNAFQLSNATTYVSDFFETPTNELIDVVFISNTNSAITNRVFFAQVSTGPVEDEIIVEWNSFFQDPITGARGTNYLTLRDSLESATNLIVITNNFFLTTPNPTFIPTNFNFLRGSSGFPAQFATPPSAAPPFPDAATNRYAAYSAFFRPTTQIPQNVFGQSITNLPGRIEITADKTLNLHDTRIAGLNYLLLKSTNHFEGSSGANIISPFTDIFLGSTNGTLAVTNLLEPNVPRFTGEVDLYAAHWTNINNNIQTVYHVLFVNSLLAPGSPSFVQDMSLRSTTVTVSDVMNVIRNFKIDAQQLTVTTNTPDAEVRAGEINLLSGDIIWSSATPNLKFLTNNGSITAQNVIFFGGNMNSPYDSTTPSDWYTDFINTGVIADQGSLIWSDYFENSGLVASGLGSIQLQAQNVLLTNGAFLATNSGSITISSGSLTVSNHVLQAVAEITLSATNILDDGSLETRVEFMTNVLNTNILALNVWSVGNGINLPVTPIHASLLGTTIYSTNSRPGSVVSTWAGIDRGNTPDGYVDNAAIGNLVLQGLNPSSVFTFAPANGRNAIYIDRLDLLGVTATNTDASGHFVGIEIRPNMTIYYSQATANGASIAEKLNGAFGLGGATGGRFSWVSNFNCGFFSSTNFAYPDGSIHKVNTALVQSCDLDSNGNGIVNCQDPAPLPLPLPACGDPPFPGGRGLLRTAFEGGTSSLGSGGVPMLGFPAARSSTGGTLSNAFVVASGSYNGIFFATNGVAAPSAGYFSASATTRGSYSARLYTGGRTYGFTGKFDPTTGLATNMVKRVGTSSLTVTLQMDLTGGDQIRGSVTDGHWTSQLMADRLVFNRISRKASQAGSYTLAIPAASDAAGSPSGHSIGTVKVDAGGGVVWAGTMADGSRVAQRSAISKDGVWPLYSSLYSGAGVTIGWMQFTNQTDSDMSGGFVWTKAAVASSKYYPNGFTNEVGAIGSSYVAPAVGTKAATTTSTSFDLTLSEGGLSSDGLLFPISIGSNDRVTSLGSNKLTLTIAGSSGLFKGTAFNPATHTLLPFQGVLLEKLNIGAGFFLGTNQSGRVYLAPPE